MLVVLYRVFQSTTFGSVHTGVISEETVNTWSEGLSDHERLDYNVAPAPKTVHIIDHSFVAVVDTRITRLVAVYCFNYEAGRNQDQRVPRF